MKCTAIFPLPCEPCNQQLFSFDLQLFAGEKTEEPTAKRKADARKKGQVGRSQEISAAFVLLAGFMAMKLLGGSIYKEIMDYTTRNHSKYCLMAHLIFVCKYRKRLLDGLGVDVKPIMYTIAEDNDFGIVEMETDKDHIHLLIEYNPTQSILDIVRLLKQISTYRI